MDTGIVAALSALAGGVIGKLLDTALGWRKVGADAATTAAATTAQREEATAALAASELAATRAWYTNEFAKLREEIARQDGKIEQLEGRIDTQRDLIRRHEDTIASQGRTIASQDLTIDLLRARVAELEGKTQTIDLNVTMGGATTPEGGT